MTGSFGTEGIRVTDDGELRGTVMVVVVMLRTKFKQFEILLLCQFLRKLPPLGKRMKFTVMMTMVVVVAMITVVVSVAVMNRRRIVCKT